ARAPAGRPDRHRGEADRPADRGKPHIPAVGDIVIVASGPSAVLAIDGGNSKTDVALIGADGALLASARGPGTSVDDRRFETSLVVLDDLVRAVARQAGICPARPV